ncbi:hypothetical protein [Arthrobacter sp. D3-16]
MRRTKASLVWLWLALTSAVLLVSVFLIQYSIAASRDLDEVCEGAGLVLDRNFRLLHEHDGSLYFPLHNRCNATYDIVPGWVNPALSTLAAVLVIALVCGLVSWAVGPLKKARVG